MKILDEYIAYLKDNPRGYWFKQKLYGIGWMPAKIQGWITLGVYLVFVLTVTALAPTEMDFNEAVVSIIAPVLGATLLLLTVAWRTGEPLHWRWGREQDNGKR